MSKQPRTIYLSAWAALSIAAAGPSMAQEAAAQAPLVGNLVSPGLAPAQPSAPDAGADPPALTNAGGYSVGEIRVLPKIPPDQLAADIAENRRRNEGLPPQILATFGRAQALTGFYMQYVYDRPSTPPKPGEPLPDGTPLPKGVAVDIDSSITQAGKVTPLREPASLGGTTSLERNDDGLDYSGTHLTEIAEDGRVSLSRVMVFGDQAILLKNLRFPSGSTAVVPLPGNRTLTITATIRPTNDRENALQAARAAGRPPAVRE